MPEGGIMIKHNELNSLDLGHYLELKTLTDTVRVYTVYTVSMFIYEIVVSEKTSLYIHLAKWVAF